MKPLINLITWGGGGGSQIVICLHSLFDLIFKVHYELLKSTTCINTFLKDNLVYGLFGFFILYVLAGTDQRKNIIEIIPSFTSCFSSYLYENTRILITAEIIFFQ